MVRVQKVPSCAILVVLAVSLACSLFGQTATGRIVGSVSDPTGALIPGASILVTNVDTKVEYQTLTNEQGLFQAPLLPIGMYTVTAEMPGFQKAVTKPEKLEINQSLRIDIKMAVGNRTEEVVVEEGITRVETISPTLGMSITGSQIANMPLNGRNTLDLVFLQPGVLPAASTITGGTGTFNVAGARQDSVTYLLDGGINNNLLSNAVVLNPNPDMIEEFKLLTNGYSAEFGRNAGGIVSVVTKSGTNQFHGTAYDYVRNNALNANSFFNNASGLPKDVLKRNQFGGTLGGPVFKEKLFFFTGWQSQRQSRLQVTNRTRVFTPAELNGDFSRSNTAGDGPDANVAAFLQRFPYFQPNAALAAQAIIDPSKVNSVANNYIKAGLIASDPSGFLISQSSALDNRDELTNKVDYVPTAKDRVIVTLGWNRQTQINPFSIATVGGFPNETRTKRYYFAANYVRTFSPSFLNDFRFSTQRNNNFQAVPGKKLPTPAELGIGITPDESTGPTILVFSSGMTAGFSNQGPSRLIDNTFTWSDTATWLKGSHTFKGGATFTPYQDNQVFDFFVNGQFNFRSTGNVSGPYSRNDRADFMLGLADEFTQFPAAPSNIRTKNFGWFFQDEWKVRRNLTLTLGMRYEYNTPKTDTQGRTFSYMQGAQSTVFTKAPKGLLFPGDALAPRGSNFPDKNDWAPRFGFAWTPDRSGRLSVRGGIGIFYDILKAEDNFQFNGQLPFFSSADLTFGALPTSTNSEALNMPQPFAAAGQRNPFPSQPPAKDLDFAAAGFLPFGGTGVYSVDPHLRTPYVYQYNLDIQREIMTNTVVDVAYAGSSSHKLTGLYDANPFVPGQTVRTFNQTPGNPTNAFSYLDLFSNVGNANYNSLQASLRGKGHDIPGVGRVTYLFSYTYSKSIDNESGFRAVNSRVPTFNSRQFRAASDFDLTNYVSLSGTWTIPSPKSWGSGPELLFSGWTIEPVVNHRSGEPLDVTARLARSRTSTGPSAAGDPNLVRANLVAPIKYFDPHISQSLPSANTSRASNFFFDPAAFSTAALTATVAQGFDPVNNPSQRTYGTFGRNAFRGPTRTNFDLSIMKMTNIGETRRLEFRAEMFNAFNRPLWRNPQVSITSATFGQISSTGSSTDSQPRVIQLAMKLHF
jgi:hypothetical protein